MLHLGAKPKKPKTIGFVQFVCTDCTVVAFDFVVRALSTFPGQVAGMPHGGDNLHSKDSRPITNCKTFVAPDLPVKMAQGR